jgi:hypothetical protein
MVKYWFVPPDKAGNKDELAAAWNEEVRSSVEVNQWYFFDKLTVGRDNRYGDLTLSYTVKSSKDLEEMRGNEWFQKTFSITITRFFHTDNVFNFPGAEIREPEKFENLNRRAKKLKITTDGQVFVAGDQPASQQVSSQPSTPAKRSKVDKESGLSTSTPESDCSRLSSVGSSLSNQSGLNDAGGLIVRVDFSKEDAIMRNKVESILTYLHSYMTRGLAGREKVKKNCSFLMNLRL